MQAARGTSIGPDSTTGRPSTRARNRLLLAAVALAAYAVDLSSKVVAADRLEGRPDVEVLGEVLQLRLIKNPGAAFGTGTDYTVVLSCVAIVAVVVVSVLALRVRTRLWAVALGLLLAGVAGNLTDRLFREPGPLRGHVIDFFMLPNWPVFNVADLCINAAAVLILVQAFRGVRLDGSRDADHDDDAGADTDDDAGADTGAETETADDTGDVR